MRIGTGMGWATQGIGYMVLSVSQFLQTTVLIMGIVAIAAYQFDLLMRSIECRIVPWKGKMLSFSRVSHCLTTRSGPMLSAR